eukprot:CAMPEP_0184321282 /NCGR_PEP_ID=MMETSP1049-20130417/118110_1 /TAXON_ID=77928 /ORGANISM="Proteomonas sulcata, Strain CCMP704" /LENGTH=288 /DNA_ID=CAMNT_0026642017 /DNA_START=57 /DNA_END=923 /DNA_ORIENTATION=-
MKKSLSAVQAYRRRNLNSEPSLLLRSETLQSFGNDKIMIHQGGDVKATYSIRHRDSQPALSGDGLGSSPDSVRHSIQGRPPAGVTIWDEVTQLGLEQEAPLEHCQAHLCTQAKIFSEHSRARQNLDLLLTLPLPAGKRSWTRKSAIRVLKVWNVKMVGYSKWLQIKPLLPVKVVRIRSMHQHEAGQACPRCSAHVSKGSATSVSGLSRLWTGSKIRHGQELRRGKKPWNRVTKRSKDQASMRTPRRGNRVFAINDIGDHSLLAKSLEELDQQDLLFPMTAMAPTHVPQ